MDYQEDTKAEKFASTIRSRAFILIKFRRSVLNITLRTEDLELFFSTNRHRSPHQCNPVVLQASLY